MADTYKFDQSASQLQQDFDDVEALVGGGHPDGAELYLTPKKYTSAEKEKLGALPTNDQLGEALAAKQDVISDLSTIRSGAAAGATAVQPSAIANMEENTNKVTSFSSPTDTQYPSAKLTYDELNKKATIKPDATLGNIALFDEDGDIFDDGIKPSDFATAAQGAKADTAYQKPGTGIPKTDLSSDVQTSLGKADTAIQDISGKADKVSGATNGNLAALDESGNLKDAGIAAEKVAQKGEIQTYSGNLVDTRSAGTAQEFTRRKSGGDGVNWMRRIKGKSLVWNQLQNGDTNLYAVGLVTKTKTNGIITLTMDSSTVGLTGMNLSPLPNKTHKYLLSAICRISSGESTVAQLSATNDGGLNINAVTISGSTFKKYSVIFSDLSSASYIWFGRFITNYTAGNAIEIKEDSLNFIDLTLMFGEGKEPATVEEFEALYNEPYYPYQPGIIKNNDAAAIESVGFNQWDEEWTTGNGTNGDIDYSVPYHLVSKNFIPVMPGRTYYFKSATSNLALYGYDANKEKISTSSLAAPQNTTFTIPDNVYFIKFQRGGSDLTYSNDICINLSDASRNGQYEPYWKKSIQLGLNAFRVTDGTNIITVNGLKSAGSVYNEIDPVRKKYIERIGEVDMGNLTWTATSAGGGADGYVANLPTMKISAYTEQNLICSKFVTKYDNSKGSIYKADAKVIVPKVNDTYTDADTFKTAMNGVPLYYELATPVEYDLVDDIPNAIEVDEDGTERAIFPEAVDPSAPFAADSNYSVSTANLVRKLNDAS